MMRLMVLLGDAELPGVDGLTTSSPRQGPHLQPVFVILAVVALLVVGFLGMDFFRQKRGERREREKLERFRRSKQAERDPGTATHARSDG